MFLRSLKVPVLLTDGASVIGSHIADSLLVRGHEVAVVDRLSTGKRENVSSQARFSEIDISSGYEEVSRTSSRRRSRTRRPSGTVMRSVREPRFDAEVNVLGTIGLLQNCVEHGVGNVVFVSTGGAVYGEQREFLATEDHPQYLLSSYEISKLAAERYLYY
jgi:UDP-glucose 4-epimerase